MLRVIVAFALICLPIQVLAQEESRLAYQPITGQAEVELRADLAYILYRIPRARSADRIAPVFMRVPTPVEIQEYQEGRLAAYEDELPDLTRRYEEALARHENRIARGRASAADAPVPPTLETFQGYQHGMINADAVRYNSTYESIESERIYLVEIQPGDYVLYGLSPRNFGGPLATCLCFGSVGFTAEAGVITDLGYIITDSAKDQSSFPELASETGFGPSTDVGYFPLLAATVRPVSEESYVPSNLRTLERRVGEYHAVGRFFTPNTEGMNRLIPVPGILGYDRERVIDLRTGLTVPDNF